MGLDLQEHEGQTPLDEDEKEGLLITTVATRGELDEFEQQNIEQAIQWTLSRKFSPQQVFTEQFVRGLHKRMYQEVWAWAGTFRKTNKNIGVDKWLIPTELKALLDDALYWITHHTYTPDELALRFKHRLVSIHCFANGNGRHSRLMADMIIEKIFGLPVFSWGSGSLSADTDTRKNYLKAVRAADAGEYSLLLAFARS
ncbi:MAG: mobile mystery protein B [Chitinophagaceae bacterium]|nr:mobile mystery protein B [Chitinophagaceae bacterium]